MNDVSAAPSRTAYDLVGGHGVVSQVVDRFYDLLETEPSYTDLRALHASDLSPMRSSLCGFFVAWLGGPRDWFDERPGACMMSAHRGIPISAAVSHQWAEAMTRAISEKVPDKDMALKLAQALSSMAIGMGQSGPA